MPRLNILTADEISQFDKPPRFSAAQRIRSIPIGYKKEPFFFTNHLTGFYVKKSISLFF